MKFPPSKEPQNIRHNGQNLVYKNSQMISNNPTIKKYPGRGANLPSFIFRIFKKYFKDQHYNQIYEDYPHIFQRVEQKIQFLNKNRKRITIADLSELFGCINREQNNQPNEEDKLFCYLNAKLLFNAISDRSLQIVTQSKCKQMLYHLISLEKYCCRLAHPLLVDRLAFK